MPYVARFINHIRARIYGNAYLVFEGTANLLEYSTFDVVGSRLRVQQQQNDLFSLVLDEVDDSDAAGLPGALALPAHLPDATGLLDNDTSLRRRRQEGGEPSFVRPPSSTLAIDSGREKFRRR